MAIANEKGQIEAIKKANEAIKKAAEQAAKIAGTGAVEKIKAEMIQKNVIASLEQATKRLKEADGNKSQVTGSMTAQIEKMKEEIKKYQLEKTRKEKKETQTPAEKAKIDEIIAGLNKEEKKGESYIKRLTEAETKNNELLNNMTDNIRKLANKFDKKSFDRIHLDPKSMFASLDGMPTPAPTPNPTIGNTEEGEKEAEKTTERQATSSQVKYLINHNLPDTITVNGVKYKINYPPGKNIKEMQMRPSSVTLTRIVEAETESRPVPAQQDQAKEQQPKTTFDDETKLEIEVEKYLGGSYIGCEVYNNPRFVELVQSKMTPEEYDKRKEKDFLEKKRIDELKKQLEEINKKAKEELQKNLGFLKTAFWDLPNLPVTFTTGTSVFLTEGSARLTWDVVAGSTELALFTNAKVAELTGWEEAETWNNERIIDIAKLNFVEDAITATNEFMDPFLIEGIRSDSFIADVFETIGYVAPATVASVVSRRRSSCGNRCFICGCKRSRKISKRIC